jgi:glycosyltransferase involved in cell wall biosynthesis
MRIAQIPPLYESVPPQLYGGTERVVAHLCDSLVDLGHDVTLFSSADARTKAQLIPVRDRALRLDPAPVKSELASHLLLLEEVQLQAQRFDVLHFHLDMLHFPIFEALAGKTVTTVHGRLDYRELPPLYARWSNFGLVSISNSQRRPLPNANWLATVGHGIPPSLYRFHERPAGNHIVFLGRLSPEKRPDRAVRLAERAGIPLRIAAKVDCADAAYFASVVEPLLRSPCVEFVGEIGEDEKSEFLGNAVALLFPIDWPEPFGLVMIEAMACGTPVIAWNRGSVPEIVDHGVTGFIVDSEDEALAAIAHAPELDRRRIRATFERRFSATAMARAYAGVYRDCWLRSLGPRVVSAIEAGHDSEG